MRRARLPWWITVLAAAFLGYFGLLVYCDAWRPEPIGLEFAFAGSRMTVTRVAPGSPAARQGIEPGDAVSACQGQAIRSAFTLENALDSYIVRDDRVAHHVAGVELAPGEATGSRTILLIDFTPMQPYVLMKPAA